MKMERRTFIGGALAASVAPKLSAFAGGERIARVGLVTDTHVGTTMESCSRVKAALELFRAKGVGLVINCGDIADRHYPEGYRCYRRTFNAVFPEAATRPRELYVYAFHDVCDYKPGSHWNLAYAAPAFADLHRLLEAPNTHTSELSWNGLTFLVFTQATGMKGFPSWADYEKAVAKACAANPGKPVFVCDHLPPAGTTFHSRQWGSEESRRILNKYPQVVSLSGHVHGSLASERQIWQGEFTAVNVGCLQTWGGFAPGSTPPHQAKENFGALVMDVHADRLVFSRYDVRDGSEAGAPWVVPLPFVAKDAPYRPEVAARRQKLAAFAAGAAVTVTPSGDGYRVEFPEARQGAEAFMYRLACERRNAAGEWVPFTRDDIFADFWKAGRDRTGRMAYRLDAAFFRTGETYRLSVAPLDFFYRPTRALTTEFTATVGQGAAVWACGGANGLSFTEYGRPVPPTVGGRFAPSSGQGTLHLPEGVFKPLKPGVRHRVVLDIDANQPDGEWCAWRLLLRSSRGRNLCEVQTAPGRPGLLRYVMAFTVPAGGLESCDILFNYVSPGASLRVAGVALV